MSSRREFDHNASMRRYRVYLDVVRQYNAQRSKTFFRKSVTSTANLPRILWGGVVAAT